MKSTKTKGGARVVRKHNLKPYLRKDHIRIIPTPKEHIPEGLVIVFNRDMGIFTNEAVCDIQAGKSRYKLPKDERKIKRLYIKGDE
jgi:hypothetical protein